MSGMQASPAEDQRGFDYDINYERKGMTINLEMWIL
jgi:hypothetical protein